MKLVDILAVNLKCWPDHMTHLWISAGNTIYGKNGSFEFEMNGGWDKPEDHRTVSVSRAEWQAAVDAINADKCEHSYANNIGCPECGELNAPKVVEPEIDWSRQPEGFPLWLEGTTAEHRNHNGWYRDSGQIFEGADGGQWRSVREGQFFTVHRKPEQKVVEWAKGSLPPIGSVVEWDGCTFAPEEPKEKDLHVGDQVTIIAHLKDGDFDIAAFTFNPSIHNAARGSVWVNQGAHGCFRPIRTAEQVAAEEREKAIKNLYYTINWNDDPANWANGVSAARKADYAKAIAAGYKKVMRK